MTVEVFTPRRVLPVMAPGLISLVLGGLGGVGIMWSWAGASFPLKLQIPQHYVLMVAGFFGALIGNELLNVLSLEWAGRQAGRPLLALYAALLWALVFTAIGGLLAAAALIYVAMLAVLALYSGEVYLKPSKVGFRPPVSNHLVVATLPVSALLFITAVFLGGSWGVAALFFPVGMIYAIMARDIALVTGVRPSRPYLGAAAYAALVVSFALWVFGHVRPAGVLLIVSGALSVMFSGVARYARRGRLFSYVKIWSAYLWLMAAGVLLVVGGPGLWWDVAVHAVALGFIFNIVFGVDVVLIDMLMTQTQQRVVVKVGRGGGAPVLELATYILLNAGLAARALYALSAAGALALLSGPLVGIAVVAFLLYTQRRLMKLSA
ncbi:hypothetical protein [Pyrobaculum ferrireducens]|uniref:Uncharacterized protein n=1 Tax=Pyrobaculum ferrireducens TaxID=1104324 RepID=G7VI87_9CREN|nr:hypothetical protein [Pyrobaculum ferrireducens]AET32179.1 hypothetical protein P186_0731 [Pyrobaculum ferrireducens]